MNTVRLFEFLERQSSSVLVQMLQDAYHEMSVAQRQSVFGKYVEDFSLDMVDGEVLLEEIVVFHSGSLDGVYFEPFAEEAKRYGELPEETEEWVEKMSEFLESTTRLTEQGDHLVAVQCYEMLFELIMEVESGSEIVYAQDPGIRLIPGDPRKYINGYITSLSVTLRPEDFTREVMPLLRQEGAVSFKHHVYTAVINIANKAQKIDLLRELKRQELRTQPRSATQVNGAAQ